MSAPSTSGVVETGCDIKPTLKPGDLVCLLGRVESISDQPPPADVVVDFFDARGNGARLKIAVSSREIHRIRFTPQPLVAAPPATPSDPIDPPRPQKPRAAG